MGGERGERRRGPKGGGGCGAVRWEPVSRAARPEPSGVRLRAAGGCVSGNVKANVL